VALGVMAGSSVGRGVGRAVMVESRV